MCSGNPLNKERQVIQWKMLIMQTSEIPQHSHEHAIKNEQVSWRWTKRVWWFFHLGTFIWRPLGTFSMYIHKRWAGKGSEKKKKSFVRDPAGCLKLLFGDLNFSCLPMSLLCPSGTEHMCPRVNFSRRLVPHKPRWGWGGFCISFSTDKSQRAPRKQTVSHSFCKTNWYLEEE